MRQAIPTTGTPRSITGYVRFSFFGPSDTRRIDYDDLEAAIGQLYNEERMAQRFHLFESICLPSIRAQTDPDFRLVVLTSTVMPPAMLERLRQVCAPVPQIDICLSEDRSIRRSLVPHLQAARDGAADGRSLHFRLDDDDAIGRDYIATLRRIAGDAEQRTFITFPRGIDAFCHANGTTQSGPRTVAFNSAGLAVMLGPDYNRNPFMVRHGDVGLRFPTITDDSIVGWLRTHHISSDTAGRHNAKRKRFERGLAQTESPSGRDADISDDLAKGFPWLTSSGLDSILLRLPEIRDMSDLPAPDLLR